LARPKLQAKVHCLVQSEPRRTPVKLVAVRKKLRWQTWLESDPCRLARQVKEFTG
jgi:hypothetical protein